MKSRRLISLLCVIAMSLTLVLPVSAAGLAEDVQNSGFINKTVSPGVVLLEEDYSYDAIAGTYAFARTYSVNLRSNSLVAFIIPIEVNNQHLDGVWVSFDEDASANSSQKVSFTVFEEDRRSLGTKHYTHSFELYEGNAKTTKLTDPVGCTFGVSAKFVNPGDNGTITVRISLNYYDSLA